MNLLLKLAFLFFIGSVLGWVLELFFRRFFSSANPERKWINPGFCTGPYLPLYGSGLCILYLIALLEDFNLIQSHFWNKFVLFSAMAICMTAIEYIAGIVSLKVGKVRLWDYTNEWGNIQGIICPKFSVIWAAIGGIYYFFIHPEILDAISWLAMHLAFSFVIGLFFGVFLTDVAKSAQLVAKLKKYADENQIILRYEEIKSEIRRHNEMVQEKYNFFHPFQTVLPLSEHVKNLRESFEQRMPKR